MESSRILQPGRNCWKICRADKVALLIDGADYFQALYESLPRAEQQILILSWDIYSHLHLIPPPKQGSPKYPTALGDLLNHLLNEKPRLRACILNWDFVLLFALDREWLPIYKLEVNSHKHLRFHLDDQCPLGSSHHQKVVVLDDQLAFAGGLDLTRGRWDTPKHRPDDPRRATVDGTSLPIRPYHDVQMAVSGPAAAELGYLARERWQRATGEDLPVPKAGPELWPDQLSVALENVDVAIARTQPPFGGIEGIYEVKQLYLDAIAAARDYIYIENQYFTSAAICEALKEKLADVDGPEVILVLPLTVDGWLSQQVMDTMRVALIRTLREADRHGRFSVYYANQPELDELSINLHAKLMIIDDRFLRIGSANLNNRSMGLDTECDLALEAAPDDTRVTSVVRAFRNRLLSQHLGCDAAEVATRIDQQGSVRRGIEMLCGNGRSLRPLEPHLTDPDPQILEDLSLADPEQPIDAERFLNHFVPHQQFKPAGRRTIVWVSVLLLLFGLAAAWRFTPLNEWLNPETLLHYATRLSELPMAPPLIIFSFIVFGLLMVPVTVLIVVAILVFGPYSGFAYSLTGSLLCALAGYGLGSLLGRNTVRRLAGKRINRVSQRLAKRGILTMLFVRIVPVAPFTVVNLVAGASHIRFWDFVIGTLAGMTPGIIGIALLTDRAKAAIETPDWTTTLSLILVAAVIFAIGFLLSRILLKVDKKTQKAGGED
ncbi:VTT domain-containing protein [Desulfuromonas sp. AOP6]|uniref:VTT domain-containing protein n=1 Tax=Desulfuromonas sp. AOP6 TaxID=1566351 RepID=UPI00126DF1F4|nr:VTT domain-containing protein [Desulfuromonas sp. AOP6]BCA79308.1 phospholipase [Desulfuromonas sp. AOP6]